MIKQTSPQAAEPTLDPRPFNHHPIFKWSKNTQQRFSAKLYTYTPKSYQANKKRSQQLQVFPDPAQTAHNQVYQPQVRQEEKQEPNYALSELESQQLEQDNKRETQEQHKYFEDQKMKMSVDIKEQSSLRAIKPKESIYRRACAKEKSESSEWTSERKSNKKKKKPVKKNARTKVSRRPKNEKREKKQRKNRKGTKAEKEIVIDILVEG